MNPETENFEALRKLLALKRHEQPPPGYFHNFSNNVMARINAREGDAEGRWLLGLWQAIMQRPLLSGALGAGVFGLVLFGLIFLQGNAQTATSTALYDPSAPFGTTALPLMQNQVANNPSQDDYSSTNPVTAGQPSLFAPPSLGVQRINYQPGN